jgi:hypothetical protein
VLLVDDRLEFAAAADQMLCAGLRSVVDRSGRAAELIIPPPVAAADANSFRASQGQIAADMTRAIDRASRNR